MKGLLALALVGGLCAFGPAASAQDIRTEQVLFEPGQHGARITGAITGRESVSYIVGTEAGQTMTVSLVPSNLATYFNVYAPGSGPGDAALATGQLTGPMMPDLNRFDGVLPMSGEYTISVYMIRSAARRNERSDYTLDISVTGDTGPVVQGDFADGLMGGPDFWGVSGLQPGDTLNLRAGPTTGAAVLARLDQGTSLRNLGCRMTEGQRWCQVKTAGGVAVTGWVAGAYLVEGGGQEAGSTPSSEPVTRTERVQFPAGATGTTLGGRLNAGDAVNYVLGARDGQFLTVNLAPQSPDTHFNIFVPGGGMLYELFKGGADGNRYRGQLHLTGDHVVTVYHIGSGPSAYQMDVRIE